MSQPPGPGKVFRHIAWETLDRTPILLNNWVHPHQPGDKMWVQDWKKEPLQPVRTGPHTVVLTTPTADKVTDITPWIHHTRVKKAAASCDEGPWKAVRDPKSLLKVQFQRQRPPPMKDAEPCSSHTPAAGWSMHSGSLRILLSKYWWVFIVNPGLYRWLLLFLCSSLQD